MDNMSTLIKLPCVLAVSTSLHISHTSPAKSSAEERTHVDSVIEKIVIFGTRFIHCVKGILWAVGFAEMCAIITIALAPNSKIASLFVKSGSRLCLTPLSAFGLFLIVFGAWLRKECYRAMKTLFTFEVSIRKDHKLITTWPYNIVRHPSYTGMLAVHIGMYCWFGSRGSWIRESGILDSMLGKMALLTFGTYNMCVIGGLIARVPVEDASLKKVFGEQWKFWARQVPYALIPGVY